MLSNFRLSKPLSICIPMIVAMGIEVCAAEIGVDHGTAQTSGQAVAGLTASESAKRAELAFNAGKFKEAAQLYDEAAQLTSAAEKSQKHVFETLGIEALFRFGKEIGDNAALKTVSDRQRAKLLEAQTRNNQAEIAVAHLDLGTTMAILAARLSDKQLYDAAVEQFDESFKIYKNQVNVGGQAKALTAKSEAAVAFGRHQIDPKYFNSAVSYAEHALNLIGKESDEEIWADAKSVLAYALQQRAQDNEDSQETMRSIDAFTDVFSVRTREKNPKKWAVARSQSATAIERIGRWNHDQPKILEAISGYMEALEVLTAERYPLERAQVQLDLGNAYLDLASSQTGVFALEQGKLAFEESLKARAHTVVPLERAMSENNLGALDWKRGDMFGESADFASALSHFRAASKMSSRDQSPKDWAFFNKNVASVLGAIWEREPKIRQQEYEAADTAFMTMLKNSKTPMPYADQLAAHQAMQEKRFGLPQLSETVSLLRDVRSMYSKENNTNQWLMIQQKLAYWLRKYGAVKRDIAILNEADEAYRLLTAELDIGIDPNRYAAVMNQWGEAKISLGLVAKNHDQLNEALEIFRIGAETATSQYTRTVLYNGLARGYQEIAHTKGAAFWKKSLEALRTARKHCPDQYFADWCRTIDRSIEATQADIKKSGG